LAIHLKKNGDLTVHQKIRADSIGMPHEEYKQHLINRLLESRGGKPPETQRNETLKKDVIEADNPVLVVGGGPSYQLNFEHIRNFRGKIIVLDINFTECVKNGIIPDYVMTIESGKQVITKELFDVECLKQCKGKTQAVASWITTTNIFSHLKSYLSAKRWTFDEEPRVSNAGLFGIVYARLELKADKIVLIGFEHAGVTYQKHIYQIWQTDFWYFIRKWPKETIVNCTDSGTLYYEDYVIDSTMEKLKIEPRSYNTVQ